MGFNNLVLIKEKTKMTTRRKLVVKLEPELFDFVCDRVNSKQTTIQAALVEIIQEAKDRS